MLIRIITPVLPGVTTGNRVTAQRWAKHLRTLGHDVRIERAYHRGPCDLLVALHAHKSAASIERFAAVHPNRPIVVALTGTDVYGDLHGDGGALPSLHAAWRIVALQPLAAKKLPEALRERVRNTKLRCPASWGRGAAVTLSALWSASPRCRTPLGSPFRRRVMCRTHQ
jgi:hypothetical protein